MDVDLVFKIAAIGILVAVLNILLSRAGRDEQALMTTIAGLVVVLVLVIQWYTSPLSSHMLAQFEYRAGQEDLARYLELPEETEEVSAP